MTDMLESSQQAVRTTVPRDTRVIVQQLEETLRPPEVRDALAADLLASQERFNNHFGTDIKSR